MTGGQWRARGFEDSSHPELNFLALALSGKKARGPPQWKRRDNVVGLDVVHSPKKDRQGPSYHYIKHYTTIYFSRIFTSFIQFL